MEQVTDEIVALITKQMQDHGLIVWYDSEQVYDEVVDQVRLPETTVLRSALPRELPGTPPPPARGSERRKEGKRGREKE